MNYNNNEDGYCIVCDGRDCEREACIRLMKSEEEIEIEHVRAKLAKELWD